MRTRYHFVDYFNLNSTLPSSDFPSTSDQTLTLNLSFLNLPIPHLSIALSPPNTSSDLLISFFDSLSSPISDDFSFHNGASLHIDMALSNFLSQVIPQYIHADFELDQSQHRIETYFNDEFTGRKGSEDVHDDDDTRAQRTRAIQLETPQLDISLENPCFSNKEDMDVFSKVSPLEISEKAVDLGFTATYLHDVQEAVYGVNKMECTVGPKVYFFNENDFIQVTEQKPRYFPILECNHMDLEHIRSIPMVDELEKLLANLEPGHVSHLDNLIANTKEIVNLGECNLLESSALKCLTMGCVESVFPTLEFYLEMDFTNAVESFSVPPAYLTSCQNILRGNSFIVLEEFRIFDMESTSCFEVLDSKEFHHHELCDVMLQNEGNFKSFDELIVSGELALVDDMFRSLPVPFLSDVGIMRPLYSIVEEVISNLKLLPFSASDGIYLDWHILEKEKLGSYVSTFHQNALTLSDLQNINFDLITIDNKLVLLNFFFSDHTFDEPNGEECSVTLDVLFEAVSRIDRNVDRIASSEGIDNKYNKPETQTHLSEINLERPSSLFKSMSPFDDLDFFLNPSKGKDDQSSVPLVKTTGKYVEQGKSEGLSNLSIENKVEASNVMEPDPMPTAACCEPTAAGFEPLQPSTLSFPDLIIVVNTQNSNKEMIISRRSTYQKILALEKGGARVIERDLDLPADIIISAEFCLLWYECRNVGKKSTGSNEAYSWLPCYIDDIATNILTSLSFAFSRCVLVFEGDTGFLSTVMESSDGIYAAAASLGIDVQLFCSYSPKMTDEIIFRCIINDSKLIRAPYPKLPESETLAESFLTKFPSVNPLTAYAVLSSGGVLIDFFKQSQEARIHQVRKFCVPGESISLLNALCRYGERGDSQSIMTDCSSSVSSGAESRYCSKLHEPERTTCHYIQDPHEIDIPVDELQQFQQLRQPVDGCLEFSRLPKVSTALISRDMKIFNDLKVPNDAWFQGVENSNPFPSDDLIGETQRMFLPTPSSLNRDNIKNTDIINKETSGDVFNLDDHSHADQVDLSFFTPFVEKDITRESEMPKFRFGEVNHSASATADEIESSSYVPSPRKRQRQRFQEEPDVLMDEEISNDPDKLNYQRKTCKVDNAQRSAGKPQVVTLSKGMLNSGETPLRRALQSANQQKGSPWTIEFLNRIREKSKLRCQSLPLGSSPCNRSPRKFCSLTKRRSPSILEFFKYQGGSCKAKLHEKRQSKSTQLPASLKSEKATSIEPSWTPVDKRARRRLSFTSNGTRGQTKLVWRDEAG